MNTMPTYDILGSFYQASHETVDAALRSALGEGKVNARPRLFGYDFKFDAPQLNLFINTTDNDGATWSINGEFSGTPDELDALVTKMTETLIQADVLYALDYSELGDDGEPVADEVSLFHPEFDERYVPPK